MAKLRKIKPKLRKMSDIILDMEKVLEEMTDPRGHDMQFYEILGILYFWTKVHAPHAIEKYTEDNSEPVLDYKHWRK